MFELKPEHVINSRIKRNCIAHYSSTNNYI